MFLKNDKAGKVLSEVDAIPGNELLSNEDAFSPLKPFNPDVPTNTVE